MSSFLQLLSAFALFSLNCIQCQNFFDYTTAYIPPNYEIRPTSNPGNSFNPLPSICSQGQYREYVCVHYTMCDPIKNTVILPGDVQNSTSTPIGRDANLPLCPDKSEFCCKLVPDTSSNEDFPPSCGIRNEYGLDRNLYINNNYASQYGEFPWMVAIMEAINSNNNLPIGSGSLIAPNVVLTSAHTVYQYCFNPRKIKVRAGQWNFRSTNPFQQQQRLPYDYQESLVNSIKVYPAFDINNLFNDVALLILHKPFELASHISPICLPEQDQQVLDQNCFVTGWGSSVQKENNKKLLKKYRLSMIDRAVCERFLQQTRLGNNFILNRSFTCAAAEYGDDICTGNGGSPLVCPDPDYPYRYIQTGIVSWGLKCGENAPGIYTDVAKFRNWIESNLNSSVQDKRINNNSVQNKTSDMTCGDESICVPYYQCNENKNVNSDGNSLIDIRFGANSCDETLQVCCKTTSTEVTADRDMDTTPLYQSSCGIRNENGVDFKIKVQTDQEAEFGEFPWMVAILKKYFTPTPNESIAICGGSLLAPNVVLTGAHCVEDYKTEDITVRAGEWDTQTTNEPYPYQERDVQAILIHENYDSKVLFNDVALLILERPLTPAKHIGTICLPQQNQIVNSKNCFVTGWGKDKFGREGMYQVILKKIQLPMVEHDTCERKLRTTRLGEYFELDPSFTCAGGEYEKDVCTGDGGGPLVCPDPYNPKRYIQTGIVAWGIDCGEEVPGVYADVGKMRKWIDETFQRLNISSEPYIL